MKRSILFLCTGNYYRSRFAEIVFNSVADKMGLPWRSTSRGLALERGSNNHGPIATSVIETLAAMKIQTIEALTRFPISATSDDFNQATQIIALKQAEHLPLILERFPDWAEKIEYWQIDDAPGRLPLIEREVMNFVARMLGGQAGQPEPRVPTPKSHEPKKKPLTAKVGRETAGRRGKGVTTVFDLPLSEDDLKDLAAKLKQRCGTGGTVKDGKIEIQGDQRERIVAELEKLGYKVKRAGG